ncbi:MAG: FAD-dependent thymidylate synthase [Dehalococcoidia bacterium]
MGTILDRRGADFAAKKRVTAAARRWSPEGAATTLVLSANARALRHIVESRTDVAAEEEMRLVAGQIAEIMRLECPLLFGDYTVADGAWTTPNRKV